MEYVFKKYVFDWLNVYVATPSLNLTLKKKFIGEVSPLTQATLNVYTNGKFEVACESIQFKQVLGVGESSLDIFLETYPSDVIFTETPVETGSCRLCLSTDKGVKWTRERLSVNSNQEVILTKDQIALFVPFQGWNGDGKPLIHVGTTFFTSTDGFMFIFEKLV